MEGLLMSMVRKQIYITPEQNKLVYKLSVREKVAEAEIIRRAIEEYLRKQIPMPENPLTEIVALGRSGNKSGSVEHDHEIYDSDR